MQIEEHAILSAEAGMGRYTSEWFSTSLLLFMVIDFGFCIIGSLCFFPSMTFSSFCPRDLNEGLVGVSRGKND